MTELLQATLKEYYGFQSFKPLQEDIIRHVLSGRDALVIMPTGGGKSLCYQIPALISGGPALVVSPLIALMRDQVTALKANGIAAAAINSNVEREELIKIHRDLETGRIRLLYVSPEKLLTGKFLTYIKQKELSLIAIDEAHCVSIWGNDFRPDYADLKRVVLEFPNTPVLALTATADKATQHDIIKQLGLRDPQRFLSSFERKNIHISVRSGQDRLGQIFEFLEQRPGESGILYCLSRRSTEEVATKLKGRGYKADFYHAKLSAGERRRVQDSFQRDELQIVCATIAFGMGIDKANIRWVIHFNMPKNVESYYQEIGRSGRDGAPAQAVMFYSFRDVTIYRKFIEDSDADDRFREVQRKKLKRIWELTQASSCRVNLILNYFGEYRTKACGHCDNCLYPPKGFNGTVYVKTAIEACREAGEQLSIYMLVDFIRGSQRQEVLARGLQQLPSYGKGKDLSREEWIDFVIQMVNLGYLEIDFTDHSNLKCTPLSELVLHSLEQVKLYRQEDNWVERPRLTKTKAEKFEEELFDLLKQARRDLAHTYSMPSYMIFSDDVLREISAMKPLTLQELHEVPGVGEFKAEQYGPEVINTVRDYSLAQRHLARVRGRTQIESLKLIREGLSPEEVAKVRNIQPGTVHGHLAQLYLHGEDIDLRRFFNPGELDLIQAAWVKAGKPEQLKPVYEQLDQPVDFGKIRMAIAIMRKG